MNDYYPFGMAMPSRTYSATSSYRYGFNGQEKSNEIFENSTTALFWEYDSRIGRRWNLDPKPNQLGSFFICLGNNPIGYRDLLGDSTVIDNKGYIVHYEAKDKDLRVFMQQDGKLIPVGNLGGTIEAKEWFKNLVNENVSTTINDLDGIIGALTFRNYVKGGGRWDYKDLNISNNRVKNGELKQHILGIAFYRHDPETNSSHDLDDTHFSFDGFINLKGQGGRAEDLNNLHFGVVAKAFGFSETFALKQAGKAEMDKWEDRWKKDKRNPRYVPESWRPTRTTYIRTVDENGISITIPQIEQLPPYGDNPVDASWIKQGFKYYDKHKEEFDKLKTIVLPNCVK